MLNFLVKTDEIWDRKKMMLLSRSLFLSVTGAWESGDPSAVPDADLFPELARDLNDVIARSREKGIKLEFRNLAVRKVELVLVQNFPDSSKDEYVARVRAHAQKIMKVADNIVQQGQRVRRRLQRGPESGTDRFRASESRTRSGKPAPGCQN